MIPHPHRGGPRPVTQIGSDRLIDTARVVICGLMLFAIWLDPTQPAVLWQTAYATLAGYLTISVLIAVFDYRYPRRIPESARLLLHCSDILFVTALVYFTQGTTNSVFGFFIYLVVVSHVRWRWKGTLATSLVVLIAYFVVMTFSPESPVRAVADDLGTTDVDEVVVRIGYLAAVAGLLAYIGYAQENATEKMLIATEWPTVMHPSDALPAFLGHACTLLGAPGIALLWLPERDAAADLVFWADGKMTSRKWPRDLIESRFERSAAVRLFHWRARPAATVLVSGYKQQVAARPPVPEKLLRACRADALLGISFRARGGYGWLISPREALASDDVIFAQIIANRFRAWADEAELYREVEEARSREQQFALARDLHDTVLQTLAGTSLQLQGVAPQIAVAYPVLAERLRTLVDTLTIEQEMLREWLHGLTVEARDAPVEEPIILEQRLGELARDIEARWELPTAWGVEPPHAATNSALDYHLTHLLLEAAANAKKHSNASQLSVRLLAEPAEICLFVTNDRREAAGPRRNRATSFDPKMLRSRVEHLGGRLSVTADQAHVTVQIAVPRGINNHG